LTRSKNRGVEGNCRHRWGNGEIGRNRRAHGFSA
jgi:hypothetical protein